MSDIFEIIYRKNNLKMKKIVLIFLFQLCIKIGFSQLVFPEVFSSIGGENKTGNAILTYTMGEPIFETLSNNASIVTQGFNQTITLSALLTKLQEINTLQVTVFPNPVQNLLNVSMAMQNSGFEVHVIDIYGRTALRKNLTSNQEALDLSHLEAGTYIFIVRSGFKNMYVTKIQKN